MVFSSDCAAALMQVSTHCPRSTLQLQVMLLVKVEDATSVAHLEPGLQLQDLSYSGTTVLTDLVVSLTVR